MNCNCNNINNTDGSGLTAYISHVYGNVLRLAIPLTLRTVTMENGEMVATDTDFIPSSDYPVTVVFSKGGVKISLEATMQNGNIAYIEDLGTIPVGKYDIAVLCKDDNGNPYRFKQVTALHIVDATADANIPSDIEYEVTTWYLDAAIFLALKGEDGVGIDDIITESSGEIGGMNTVTIVLTNGETRTFTVMNGSGQVDSDFNINSPHPLSNSTITAKFNAIDSSIDGLFGNVDYDSQSKTIRFYNKDRSRVLATLDARPFIKDGMVNSVYISNNTLVITFNTDAGREAIGVSLSSIFNPNNYYTKTQVNNLLGNYYDKEAVNNFINNKADVLNDGRIPAIEATPVVLDYIYAPPSGSPIIPINPQAGEVIYFANEHKIRRYYNKNSGQSGGIPAIVYVDETPSKNVVYYNKDDEKFYLYDVGSLSMVEIETGSGSGGYEPPVGGIPKSDLASDVQTSLGKADTALQSQEQADWNESDSSDPAYIKNKPTIPDVSGFATSSDVADAVADLVNSAPATLDTLKELADALGDDPNFATTMTTALAGKVDKVSGKGLSTEDYTTAEKSKLEGLSNYDDTALQAAVAGKVDKETGKSLMTDAERTKLQGIAAGAEVNVQPNWTQTNTSADDYIKNKPTLATVATSGSYNDLQDKPTIPVAYDDTTLSGRVSALENAGFITTETDPTVPSWAKADTKPTYTAQEVGALPASTTIPTKTSELTNDSGFIDKAMFYGTCATEASTMPKVCTVETFPTYTDNGVTHAKEGAIIAVKFTNSDTNTTDAPELNVNGIGAKAIMYNNAIVTSTAKNTTVAGYAKQIAYYRYDPELDEGNGAWEYLGKSVDSNSTYSNASLGQGYATQSNSAAATAITASISSYALSAGGFVTIKFVYDVPANATLNISSKGAKAIYNQGAPITAGVIKAGDTATFVYSTYYHLISIDSWQDKQDAISDLATIRSGAAAGATAVQQSLLADVAISGDYADLDNKPTLFSGNYNDLTNKPTIPSAQVNADWNASSGVMEILNKPTIPTKFSDLVDDSDYIKAEDVASIVVGSADVVITETASHICITFVTTSITFTPNTTMSLWSGQKVGTLTVSGTHLKQDITLTVPANFTAQVSGGTAAQSITIPQTGGEVTGVSVTITYTGADSGSYNGSITATSGSATANVGLVYSQYQGATIIAGTISTINSTMGGSQVGELNVSGVNLEGDITASVGSGDFTICATQNGTYGTTATISKASAEASGGATLFVKYTPSSGTSTASGTLTLTTPKDGSTTTESVSLSGKVAGTLSITPSTGTIGIASGGSGTTQFTVQGTYLTPASTAMVAVSGTGMSADKQTLTAGQDGTINEVVTVTFSGSADSNGTLTVSHADVDNDATASIAGVITTPLPVDAEFQVGKLKYKVLSGQSTVSVAQISSSATTGDIVIPSTVNDSGVTATLTDSSTQLGVGCTYTVTTIASSGFNGNNKITSLVLPNTITTMGVNGIRDLSNNGMTSFVIPNSVTSISANNLYGMTKLTSLTIGSGATVLPDYFMGSCEAMRSITIPNNITEIKNYAFAKNTTTSFTNVDLGTGLTKIGANSYFRMTDDGVVTIRYTGGVISIGGTAFRNKSGGYPTTATLYVPSSLVDTYKTAPGFGVNNGGGWHLFDPNNIYAIQE